MTDRDDTDRRDDSDRRDVERLRDQTDDHAREIRDAGREISELSGNVSALRVSIEAHERLDTERHTGVMAGIARLEAAVIDATMAQRAATGELGITRRAKIDATVRVVLATLTTVGGIAAAVYGGSQILPAPVAPGTAHQQAVEQTWQGKRAEEVREDAVEGATPD